MGPLGVTHDARRLLANTRAGRSLSEGSRQLGRRARRAIGLTDITLDPRLASMECVFRAPPLTPELCAAIKPISPHLGVAPNEEFRRMWETEQNGACWGEYEALQPVLGQIHPQKVLEIGPGMGRSMVFFSKKLGWPRVDAYEGDGTRTFNTIRGPRSDQSFYGNTTVLQQILDFNGVEAQIFDAHQTRLAGLPGPYDLVYSFYAAGYHWAIEHFLDDILAITHEKSIGIFTVPLNYRTPPEGLYSSVIDFKPVWPKNAHLKLLVLSQSPL